MPAVLYLSHTGVWGGGGEVVLRQMVRAARAAGYSPYLACPPGELADRLEPLCDCVYRLPVPWVRRPEAREITAIPGMMSAWLIGMLQITHVLIKSRASIIHANSGVAALAACLPAAALGRPMVWHQHDLVPQRRINRAVLGLCGKLSSAVVATSCAVARTLRPLGVPAQRLHVIYPRLSAEFDGQFSGEISRKDLGVPEQAMLATVIGRLVPRKGHHVFLQALAQLPDEDNSLHGLLIGSSTSRDPVSEEYTRQLKWMTTWPVLRGKVTHIERRDDIPDVLGLSDVLVIPSYAEPLGIVALEACACGVPVIAVGAGGLPEILTDERTALLVPPGDAGALASALHRLLHEKELRAHLAKNGPHAARSFQEQGLVLELQRLYASVLHRHSPAGDEFASVHEASK